MRKKETSRKSKKKTEKDDAQSIRRLSEVLKAELSDVATKGAQIAVV